MLLPIGRGYRGLVGGHAGQCAATRFMTIVWLPVVPTGGAWLFNPTTEAGHDMKMSARSVTAAYTRSWGPLVAAVSAMAGGAGSYLAAAIVGLVGWTWSWRVVFDRGRRKRLAMNQLALGTGCEPVEMTSDYADEVRERVDDAWRQHGTGGSPGDVARFGTNDPVIAAAAYGVIRMSAVGATRARRRELESDARRIVDGVRELPSGDREHPYRGTTGLERTQRSSPVPARPSEPAVAAVVEPDDSPVTALAVARLSQLLRDTLVPEGFEPLAFDAEVLGVPVEVVLVQRRFGSRSAVVHLHAPRGKFAILANRFGSSPRDDLVTMSAALVASLGIRIGFGPARSLVLHLVWSGAGTRSRDGGIDRAIVEHTRDLAIGSITVADFAARDASSVRAKLPRSDAAIADAVERCARELST